MRFGRPLGRLLGAWALTALVIGLTLPLGTRVSAAITAARFLVEFLTGGDRPWLTRVTEPPSVESLTGAAPVDGLAVDLWLPGPHHLRPRPGLVLVHGLTPDGKRDARLAWTADRLARAGFAVAVPDLPDLRAQRMRPGDAGVVRNTLLRLATHPAVRDEPVAVIAVSVGLGPVALALSEPRIGARARVLLTLGGYGDARELVRYFTTGTYAF